MSNYEFGFKVRFHKSSPYLESVTAGWVVSLPHQCDAWEITGTKWGPETKEKAIEDLSRFISEAQEALIALHAGRQHNLTENDIFEDSE